MYASKAEPRKVSHLKEDVSAKVHFHNSKQNLSSWFRVTAEFDNLTTSQLEWIVQVLKQVDVKEQNLDYLSAGWVKKGEPYKIEEA